MATITLSGGFRPSTKDTPLDVRTRVRNYSEIQHIQNAYLGMEITVLEDETNNGKKTKYEVVNLLPSETGIPNALIDVNTLKRKIDIYEDNGNLVVGDSNNEDNSKKLQTKYDDSLFTHNKEIPSAINELKIAIDNVDSGSGLTTEQVQQLQTAYEHSQSPHVQQSDIPTKVSDLENDSGYISTIPEEYITETKLTAKGYLTEHQDLSEYAKTVNIPTKTSNLTNDSEFITSTEMTNAISIYQTIQDDTLSTTDKTVAGAINEVKNAISLNSENISELSSQLDTKAKKEEVNLLKTQVDNMVLESGSSDIEVVQARGGWINLDNNLANIKTDEINDNIYIKENDDFSYVFSSNITNITNYNRVFILTDKTIKNGIKSVKFKTLKNNGVYNDFTLYLFRKIDENTYSIVYKNTINVVDGNAIFTDIKVNEELYLGFKGEVQYTNSAVNVGVYTTLQTNINNNIMSTGTHEKATYNYNLEVYSDNIIPVMNKEINNLKDGINDINYNYRDLYETNLIDKTSNFTETSGGITNINRIFINKDLLINKGIKKLEFKIREVSGVYEDLTLYILKDKGNNSFEIKNTYTIKPVEGIATITNVFYAEPFYIGVSGNMQYATAGEDLQSFYNPLKGTIVNNILQVDSIDNLKLNGKIEYYLDDIIIDKILTEIEQLKSGVALETKIINCFGDSLTYGAGSSNPRGGYVTRLGNLLGQEWVLNNFGVGGETSNTIASRQGGMNFILQPNITIPTDVSEIEVSLLTNDGQETQLRGSINCSIKGIDGVLKNNSDFTKNLFIRNSIGEELTISRPTTIITEQSKTKCDIGIFFMGQNGGYNDDINTLVNQYKSMINYHKYYNNSNKYLLIGLHSGDNESRNPLEKAMFNEFGRNYINIRDYMHTPIYDDNGEIVSCYPCDDLGITPTEKDLRLLKNYGYVPLDSITGDGVHFTDGGYDIVANLIYNRGKELGYW